MTSDLLDAPFAGRPAFRDAVRRLLAEAAQSGWRELSWCDPDFADWPLDDAAVLASLSTWLRPHRRLTVVGAGYDDIVRRHPRWVAWRRLWSHGVVCRQADDDIAADLPTLLVAPSGRALRLLDQASHRGFVTSAKPDVAQLQNDFVAVSRRSVDAFGATMLGL